MTRKASRVASAASDAAAGQRAVNMQVDFADQKRAKERTEAPPPPLPDPGEPAQPHTETEVEKRARVLREGGKSIPPGSVPDFVPRVVEGLCAHGYPSTDGVCHHEHGMCHTGFDKFAPFVHPGQVAASRAEPQLPGVEVLDLTLVEADRLSTIGTQAFWKFRQGIGDAAPVHPSLVASIARYDKQAGLIYVWTPDEPGRVTIVPVLACKSFHCATGSIELHANSHAS